MTFWIAAALATRWLYLRCFSCSTGSMVSITPSPPKLSHLAKPLYASTLFETLYAHSAERLQLLNRVAPQFFWQQQATMCEDILLALARITDPPRSVGKEHLTIRGLDRIMPDQALTQEVRDLIAAAVSNCSFARDWRNRRLAHNDLDLKLKQSA